MDQLVSAIAQHGYAILFTFVFLEVIGLPVPAAPLLIIAGGASADGVLNPVHSILTALSAMVLGDALMFLVGRYTGWWLLGVLCRLSLSPESCILRSADAFYKKGRAVLIFAKFVPGISALAVPLAGSMKMRVPQFVAFDLGGALLYTLAYWSVGFVCSGFVGPIIGGYSRVGDFLVWGVAIPVAIYIAWRLFVMVRERRHDTVLRVTPADVARKLDEVALFDVRSHGYYEAGTMRIKGSSRLEPNGVNQNAVELPRDKELILYCTCVRDATSVKVAHALAERGYRVSVIRGGLRAWKRAGLAAAVRRARRGRPTRDAGCSHHRAEFRLTGRGTSASTGQREARTLGSHRSPRHLLARHRHPQYFRGTASQRKLCPQSF